MGFRLRSHSALSPDVATIIKKSVAANEVDFEAAPHYGYREPVRTVQTTKTYGVMMIDGSPYSRLISISGKPLSQDATDKEQQKLEHVKSQRASESKGIVKRGSRSMKKAAGAIV